tara:strand:- start:1304 stop:2467 length:1164 start_codon:yes stop_codon:yes gene_type:complete
MSQGDQFHQYGYDHYLKAPKKPKTPQPQYSGGRLALLRNMQKPPLASMALLGAAVLFVGVIVMTYPSDDRQSNPIPIVKADLRPVKERPVDAGGMEIPNMKSTILARADQPSIKDERDKIENLLQRHKEQSVMSKGQAIHQSMETAAVQNQVAADVASEHGLVLPRSGEEGAVNILSADISADSNEAGDASASSSAVGDKVFASAKPAFDVKEPKADDILQKIGSSQNDGTDGTQEHADKFAMQVASAALVGKPARAGAPKTIHQAGKSPETIEFVRSVLGEKQGTQQPQNIEPAAGVSSHAAEITAGVYFVQLASITDPARAKSEWMKMQGQYNVLGQSNFRIQEASLSNGKFYRIQAGPMSKDSANRICDALTRAKKPGGCIVVK